jgi:hypothetical protein
MEEKNDPSQKIQTICQHANRAVREELSSDAYRQYAKAFESLLKEYVSKKDKEIHELVSTVFMVYDDMLDEAEQEPEQTKKLYHYIQTLLDKIKKDHKYLAQWTVQSIIDALFQSQHLKHELEKSDKALEEEIEASVLELEEILNMDRQKSDLLTADDLDSTEDDNIDLEMEKALHLTLEDRQAPSAQHSNQADKILKFVEQYSTQHNNKALDSETSSLDSSRSTEVETYSSDFEDANLDFANNMTLLIADFQKQANSGRLNAKDRLDIEATTTAMTKKVLELQNRYFSQDFTEDNLLQFQQAMEKTIIDWSYSSAKDLSSQASPILGQAFAKLIMNLGKVIDETKAELTATTKSKFSPE